MGNFKEEYFFSFMTQARDPSMRPFSHSLFFAMTPQRFSRCLLCMLASLALCVGCTIITQPDRSKIDNNAGDDDDNGAAGDSGAAGSSNE